MGVSRCNYVGCSNSPNTIITNAHPKAKMFGLCEEHFQMGNKPGGCHLDLEFGKVGV